MGFNPFDVFNPGKGYGDASKEFEKYYNQAIGFMQPFQQAGVNQIDTLTGAENALLNPAQLQSEWSSGYETSPYAQQLQKEAMSNGMDAASSMGLMGSSTALNNAQQGSTNIMQADRDKYMDDLMKKYMAGIGIGTNIYDTGASMGSAMGNMAMSQGNRMGEAAYGKSNAMGDMMRSLLNEASKGAMMGLML